MKNNSRIYITTALAAGLLTIGSFVRADDNSPSGASDTSSKASSGASTSLSSRDSKFIRDVAEGNLMEIQVGQLGIQKAQNDQVKQFAQKLIDDHTSVKQQLQTLAQQKSVDLPTEPTKRATGMIEHLQGLSGQDFDKQFVKHMVRDHEKDIKEFQKESEKGDDADVKSFASQTLPKLQEHLATAQNLENTVTAKKGGTVKEPAGAEQKENKKY